MTKSMDYFKVPEPSDPKEPLYADEAKEIIALFRQGKDETRIFKEDNIPRYKIEEAKAEWLRIQKEVYDKIRGQHVIKEGIPAEFDEKGKETKAEVPTEYYKVTTGAKFLTDLSSSDLFTPKDVKDDILAYDEKTPWKPLTWAQFKAKYYPK